MPKIGSNKGLSLVSRRGLSVDHMTEKASKIVGFLLSPASERLLAAPSPSERREYLLLFHSDKVGSLTKSHFVNAFSDKGEKLLSLIGEKVTSFLGTDTPAVEVCPQRWTENNLDGLAGWNYHPNRERLEKEQAWKNTRQNLEFQDVEKAADILQILFQPLDAASKERLEAVMREVRIIKCDGSTIPPATFPDPKRTFLTHRHFVKALELDVTGKALIELIKDQCRSLTCKLNG